jgi:hypothetical protein
MLTRGDIRFTHHALFVRMATLAVTPDDVLTVLNDGELIEPSLMLGWRNGRPLHVAFAPKDGKTIIITVYVPDPALWSPDFRRRVKQ